MNAEKLYELAHLLLAEEALSQLQEKLEILRTSLQNLGSSPSDPNLQNQVSHSASQLRAASQSIVDKQTPALEASITAIEGSPYFSRKLDEKVDEIINANAMTPAVAAQLVGSLADERRQYIDRLNQLNAALGGLGIQMPDTVIGEAELGFLIPRDLFGNELGQFSKELAHINNLVRTFSELVTGSVQEVKLRQLSTSDPWILVCAGVLVVREIGNCITWVLDNWKKALEIKKIYEESKSLNLKKSVIKGLEESIKEQVEKAIEDKVELLMNNYSKYDESQKGELENRLRLSMRKLLSRIEMGMQVEIRYLPDPNSLAEEEEAGGVNDEEYKARTELPEIAKQLVFPKPSGDALLRLVWDRDSKLDPTGDE